MQPIFLAQITALLASGLFSGAALYINLVEHPARRALPETQAKMQFRPSYRRAARLQAPLALIALLAGLSVWLGGGHWGWCAAGLLTGLVVPYTLIVIMPTNRLLLSDQDAQEPIAPLLDRWNRYHAVRTLAGFVAFVWFTVLAVGQL